jgi:hypothetical protein
MRRTVVAVAVILTMSLFTLSAFADVINGGFEDPQLNYGTWVGTYTSIPGWIATSGTIEIQNHVAGSPYEGNQHVELDSYGNSAMQQTVATVAGTMYDFSFAYSPRPDIAPVSNIIYVYFNGTLLDHLTGFSTPDTTWTMHNYSVTATSSISTLAFAAAGTSDSLGGYLDAVHFTASNTTVPEPTSMLLFGAGLTGLGLLRRRISK